MNDKIAASEGPSLTLTEGGRTMTFAPRCGWSSPALRVSDALGKGGRGVFAAQPIAAGELLVVWGGVELPYATLASLPESARRFSLQVDEDVFLVTLGPPEPGDLVNHSCDPNAGLDGPTRLVSLRSIAAGEEVNFDYAMSEAEPLEPFPCGCGAPSCRKMITGRDWSNPDLWRRYGSAFSPYLLRRISAGHP